MMRAVRSALCYAAVLRSATVTRDAVVDAALILRALRASVMRGFR